MKDINGIREQLEHLELSEEEKDVEVVLWMYHNEVSMRVQRGMDMDKKRHCYSEVGCDWNYPRYLKAALSDMFATDKRWPSPSECASCWQKDAEACQQAQASVEDDD